MTELDHTSFDTLMADLSHCPFYQSVFRFQYDNGRSPPWVFVKMTRIFDKNLPSSVCLYIDIKYGSMDSGKWVDDEPALHVFNLCNGHLQDSGDDEKIKVVLVNGVPLSALSKSLDDQLNKNLRGVFA